MRLKVVVVPILISGWCTASPALAADVPADPSNYKDQLATLAPGDTLQLAAGDYLEGLRIEDIHGTPSQPITIEGPADGSARFVGRSCCNTIDITNASYVTIRHIFFDGNGEAVDAIKAGGSAGDFAHHITVEGCTIVNHDVGQTNQQIVGISTKIVAWDWLIRGNTIGDASGAQGSAGTGLYLGNSDGTAAFIGGVIEGNLIVDTLGYNMQIKHQNARDAAEGVPQDERSTIIRHNVFIKDDTLPSPDGLRPNLLISGYPDSGPGSTDFVQIYGNFFYNRGSGDQDSLVQGSGRVHIHDNLFVSSSGAAIRLVEHQGKTVIDALVYNNTMYEVARGLTFAHQPTGASLVTGNAIFSTQEPFFGVDTESENYLGAVGDAAGLVASPSVVLGEMDFYPSAGSALGGMTIDLSLASSDADYDRDFDGTEKDFSYSGAYHGEGTHDGWSPDATLKPLPGQETSGSGGAGASSAASSGAGTGGGGGGETGDDGGCSCSLVRPSHGLGGWLLIVGFLLAHRRRRP